MSARLYVEGGGDRREQQAALRQAFGNLLDKAGFRRPRAPAIVCAGSRNQAFREFCNALRTHGGSALLLVDAEAAVDGATWQHVHRRDGWVKPEAASDDQLHLMVQMMENWMLCDRAMLADYFGGGFGERHLPGTEDDVESLDKPRVAEGLYKATRDSKKGKYGKGAHSAELLRRLDPERLRRAAPHFEKLLVALSARLPQGRR